MINTDKNLEDFNNMITNLSREFIYNNRIFEVCPFCGTKKYIKYGFYKGIQRYKCNNCEKTFSNTTNSLWSYSKKEPNKWLKFVEYVVKRKSLRFCAKELEISLVTAFYWRHKILHGLNLDSIPSKLSGDVYMCKKLIPENFKGSRNIIINKRHNIWVVAAKGNENSLIAKPISRAFWDLPSFNKKIYYLIEKKAYITSYGDRYLELVAKKHNKKRLKEVHDDNKIKFFHNTLGLWLKKYYGVATKYLENYISLFVLFLIGTKISHHEIFTQLLLKNNFLKVDKIGCGNAYNSSL